MKKYFIIIATCIIGIGACLSWLETVWPKNEETVEQIALQTLLSKEAPDKIVFWLCNTEYKVENEKEVEELWSKLRAMQGREETLEAMIEGGYYIECFRGQNLQGYLIDGYGIRIRGQRYYIGEDMLDWIDELRLAVGLDAIPRMSDQ